MFSRFLPAPIPPWPEFNFDSCATTLPPNVDFEIFQLSTGSDLPFSLLKYWRESQLENRLGNLPTALQPLLGVASSDTFKEIIGLSVHLFDRFEIVARS